MNTDAEATRRCIEATSRLTVEQRCDILSSVLGELTLTPHDINESRAKKVAKALKNRGYEPMMFKQAANILRDTFNAKGFSS